MVASIPEQAPKRDPAWALLAKGELQALGGEMGFELAPPATDFG